MNSFNLRIVGLVLAAIGVYQASQGQEPNPEWWAWVLGLIGGGGAVATFAPQLAKALGAPSPSPPEPLEAAAAAGTTLPPMDESTQHLVASLHVIADYGRATGDPDLQQCIAELADALHQSLYCEGGRTHEQ